MNKTHRTIRYRLHPRSVAKSAMLWGTAGACRFVWNHFVAKLRDDYVFYGECNPRFFTIGKQFVNLRRQVPWLRDYSCATVRLSLKPIQTAYEQYFKGAGGLPRFKGKYFTDASFPLTAGTFKMMGRNYLHVQRIGTMRLTGHNSYPDAKAVSGTIKNECGMWYAYLTCEVEAAAELKVVREVGIDRNAGQVTLSDGTRYEMPNMTRLEARKRRYQRMMSRRRCGSLKHGTKPSNRYLKARLMARKTHQKIAHARANWCHHVSRKVADRYNLVYLEDLNIAGMTASAKGTAEKPGKNVKQKTGLNRTIRSSGWGKLDQCLDYKSNVVKVPAAYTSQKCRACGHTAKQNRKTQSDFHCVKCGHRANADMNAALNILAFGNGAAGRGDGGVARSVKRQNEQKFPADYCI